MTADEMKSILGPNVKRYREQRGWEQKMLASEVKYKNHSAIANIEAGTFLPPLHKFVNIARALQVPLDALLEPKQEEYVEHAREMTYLARQLPVPVRLALLVLLRAMVA